MGGRHNTGDILYAYIGEAQTKCPCTFNCFRSVTCELISTISLQQRHMKTLCMGISYISRTIPMFISSLSHRSVTQKSPFTAYHTGAAQTSVCMQHKEASHMNCSYRSALPEEFFSNISNRDVTRKIVIYNISYESDTPRECWMQRIIV